VAKKKHRPKRGGGGPNEEWGVDTKSTNFPRPMLLWGCTNSLAQREDKNLFPRSPTENCRGGPVPFSGKLGGDIFPFGVVWQIKGNFGGTFLFRKKGFCLGGGGGGGGGGDGFQGGGGGGGGYTRCVKRFAEGGGKKKPQGGFFPGPVVDFVFFFQTTPKKGKVPPTVCLEKGPHGRVARPGEFPMFLTPPVFSPGQGPGTGKGGEKKQPFFFPPKKKSVGFFSERGFP